MEDQPKMYQCLIGVFDPHFAGTYSGFVDPGAAFPAELFRLLARSLHCELSWRRHQGRGTRLVFDPIKARMSTRLGWGWSEVDWCIWAE